MIETWDDLTYWNSGEWQVIQEKLDDMDKVGTIYCPAREHLFAALDACPLDKVKVAIIGQDPYPEPKYATGLAFSIPKSAKTFPLTLEIILKEYCNDLHHPMPTTGNLDKWSKQGVLLWNAIPSCESGKSLSHNFPEWWLLSEEIVRTLSERGIVFLFQGQRASVLSKLVDEIKNETLRVAHPAAERYFPKDGQRKVGRPLFTGSRIFTTINDLLIQNGQEKVDWRL